MLRAKLRPDRRERTGSHPKKNGVMHHPHMDGLAPGQSPHGLMDRVSYAQSAAQRLVTQRLHLLKGQLVSEDLITGFPLDDFVVYVD
jgi:hypothetical protein